MDQITSKPSNMLDFLEVVSTTIEDVDKAMEEIARGVNQQTLSFLLLFLPDHFDQQSLGLAIEKHLSDTIVFALSSAGHITPNGYDKSQYFAIGFKKQNFRMASMMIEPLNPFDIREMATKIEYFSHRFTHTAGWNRLGLIFADGLSKQEDILIATLAAILPDLQIFGGSAAECRNAGITLIYANKKFHQNAALFLLLETDLDFQLVTFGHFKPTDKKMVVTKADPKARIVSELNGAPATEEYANLVGVDIKDLSPEIFAQNPFLIKLADEYHVRSIQKCNENDELELLCSIDEGLILTLGQAGEIVRRMESEFARLQKWGKPPAFILAFDCFLRRLEFEQTDRLERASKVLNQYNVLGFNSYGEQHSGIHVNHTFVGIAFYPPPKRVMP